jgi:cytoskeletal protein CcmA (bactofilin family)
MWRKQPDAAPSAPRAASLPAAAGLPEAEEGGPGSIYEPRAETARLTRAIVVNGEISGGGDLYLDGEVEGSIRLSDSLVTVGPHGCVKAEIEANEIVIEGRVTGNIWARTRVEAHATAQVSANVVTHRIAIHEGARFNGKVDIVRPEDARPSSRSGAAAAAAESVPAVSFETAQEAKDPLQ